jgi:TetR/AcrR family transcriptional regulator
MPASAYPIISYSKFALTTLVKIYIDRCGQWCYNAGIDRKRGGGSLYSKFEGLDEEKQMRILNAAMKEFAAKGYDDASTNRIVEAAGIAKGLLFHYFKSKKQLFLYLYDRCLELVTREVLGKVDFTEKDFFNRLIVAQTAKLELIRKYPDIMNFLQAAYLDQSVAVRPDLDERKKDLLLVNFSRAFEDVDTSAFREGLDIGLVIRTVAWAFEGFANAYFEKIRHLPAFEPDYDALFAEAREYVEFLKKCFYK